MSFATPLVEHLVRSAFDLLGFDIKRRRRAIRTRPSTKKRTTFDGSISGRFKMYHIGCGPDIVDEFLNIDGDFDSWFEYNLRCPYNLQSDRLYAVRGKPSTYVLQHDLRNGIPAASDSLKVIYHSHFLEHLTDDQGIAFLSECHRCLAPGGSMRFAVPDFNLWCSNYISGNTKFFNWYRNAYLDDNPHYKTNAQVFMGMLYNWGHKMAYDYGSLVERLGTIGFTNIRRADWGTSEKIPNIASLEDPQSVRRPESLVVECTKGPKRLNQNS
jgi:predicted SAM-dependent methyltransferase